MSLDRFESLRHWSVGSIYGKLMDVRLRPAAPSLTYAQEVWLGSCKWYRSTLNAQTRFVSNGIIPLVAGFWAASMKTLLWQDYSASSSNCRSNSRSDTYFSFVTHRSKNNAAAVQEGNWIAIVRQNTELSRGRIQYVRQRRKKLKHAADSHHSNKKGESERMDGSWVSSWTDRTFMYTRWHENKRQKTIICTRNSMLHRKIDR